MRQVQFPKRSGLTLKFSLPIAVTVVCTVTVICFVFIVNEKRTILERTRMESISLAKTVAAALANAVVLKEWAFIVEHCMLVLKTRKDLRYIIVLKPDGKSMVHQRGEWKIARLAAPIDLRMGRVVKPVMTRHLSPITKDEVLEAAVPIFISSSKWGVIRLGYSVKPLEAHLAEMTRQAVLIGIGCLIFGVLVALMLARLVSRRIRLLTATARRISAGESGQLVAIRSRDEIGELATTFNRMVVGLEEAMAAEKAKSEQLTAAYQRLNTALVELRETQAQLIQSGRLASIGELAAGVAHEINNPLSVVLTYAVMLTRKIQATPDDLRDHLGDFERQLGKIAAAAERCKTIADNLLTFSRQSEAEMATVSLAEIVDQTFDLIGTTFSKSRIKVIKDVPPKLRVWGNATELQQVLINLAMNAAQAMVSDGTLTVRGTNSRGGVTWEICDTGPGIAPEHLDRIFDPFFTTKPVGKGTGLGLSIVYGIIERHRGSIKAEPGAEEGVTFRIHLPSRPEEAT